VNAGTFSCNRTRAHFGHTFNIIDIDNENITVTVVNITNNKQKKMIKFNLENKHYKNVYYNPDIRIE
jgi:hypothetical protein